MSKVPIDPPRYHECLAGGFCLKSIYCPIVMEEDMLWFWTNYQLLPCPTVSNHFNPIQRLPGAMREFSFVSGATLRTRRSNGESRGVLSGFAMPCHISEKL